MKKVGTAAAKATRNFRDRKLTISLDLGDRSSWYCVFDEAGEVRLEQRLGTTPKAMKEVFGGMPRSRIALETGMHSPWVSRLLSELGHEVIVAHARNVRHLGAHYSAPIRTPLVGCEEAPLACRHRRNYIARCCGQQHNCQSGP